VFGRQSRNALEHRRHLPCVTRKIPQPFLAVRVRTAWNPLDWYANMLELVRITSRPRNRNPRGPSLFPDGRKQIQQAALAAAGVAELVQEEDIHCLSEYCPQPAQPAFFPVNTRGKVNATILTRRSSDLDLTS
jgi:hypothetical protein